MIMILKIKCKFARPGLKWTTRTASELFAEFTLSISLKLPNLVLELC